MFLSEKARKIKIFFFHSGCLILTGCALVINGTTQEVSISTSPPGATVSDGTTTTKTPGKLKLQRGQDHLLTITKPGYETESIRVIRVVSGAVAGNILLPAGLVGWGIDAASGAQWRLEPSLVSVSLRPALRRYFPFEEAIENREAIDEWDVG